VSDQRIHPPRADHAAETNGQVLLNLGDPAPVPEPFASFDQAAPLCASSTEDSTVTALLHQQLTGRGLAVLATKEPSGSRLGNLARHGTGDYGGLTLACLVTADRYYHLEHEIRPALRAGRTVLCDRYVPTSLVLQRIDGVEPAFLRQLNQHADVPDLTIILTGEPAKSRARARQRHLQPLPPRRMGALR
jgi:thymidylate kinase